MFSFIIKHRNSDGRRELLLFPFFHPRLRFSFSILPSPVIFLTVRENTNNEQKEEVIPCLPPEHSNGNGNGNGDGGEAFPLVPFR